MQVHFRSIDIDPDYIAWVECKPEDLDKVKEIFPVENHEILVGLKYNHDPLTCDTYTPVSYTHLTLPTNREV